MNAKLIALALPSLLLSGCVPFPNFRYYAPAVAGVVTQNGIPVEGAQIRVSGQFSEAVHSSTSDKNGRFATEPIRKLLFTATLIGDPLYGYSVGVVVGGREYEGYSETSVGYGPSTLEIQCDLSRPMNRGNRQVFCSPTVHTR